MPQHKPIQTAFLIVGIIIFLLLGIIPALYTFLVSFSNFDILHGIWGSPWVGTANYSALTRSFHFPRILYNAFIYFLIPTLFAAIITIPIAGYIGSMKAGRQRSLVTFALLLPAFVPDIIVAVLVLYIGSNMALATHSSFRIILILLYVIRPAAICAFVGASAAGIFNDKGKNIMHGAVFGMVIGIAASLVRFLSSNMELHTLVQTPFVMETADTFDIFAFRVGMQMLDMPLASAAWVFRTAIQLCAVPIVALLVHSCVLRGDTPGNHDHDIRQPDRVGMHAGVVLGALVTVLFMAALIVAITRGHDSYVQYPQSLFNSAVITVLSSVLFAIITFMLGYWLSANVNKLGAIVLVLLMVTLTNNFIGEFLFYRALGLTNTHFSVAAVNGFNLAFVLPLAYLARLKNRETGFRHMLPPFIAFFGLFVANTWASGWSQLIHTMQANHMGVGLALRNNLHGGAPTSLILGVVIPVFVITAGTAVAYALASQAQQ